MELTIDTAGDQIGLGVSREGHIIAERILAAERAHTATLAPGIEDLLEDAGQAMRDVTAIFVCTGPGGYTGLRAGVTAGKGLAIALGVPIVGVDRFRAEAYPLRSEPGAVVVVHHVVRREYAWQEMSRGEPASPARAGSISELLEAAKDAVTVAGEIDDGLAEALGERRLVRGEHARRRPGNIAALGWARLGPGDADDPAALAPVYLREPAIGPQKQTGEDTA